jgi:hypothetical protein
MLGIRAPYDKALAPDSRDNLFAAEVKTIARALGLNGAKLARNLGYTSATLAEHLRAKKPRDPAQRASDYARALVKDTKFRQYHEPLAEHLRLTLKEMGVAQAWPEVEHYADIAREFRATIDELGSYLTPGAPHAIFEAIGGTEERVSRYWPLLFDVYRQRIRRSVHQTLSVVDSPTVQTRTREWFLALCKRHGFSVTPFFTNSKGILADVWLATFTELGEPAQERILNMVRNELKKLGVHDEAQEDALRRFRDETTTLLEQGRKS